jgi:uncharacterized protein YkwD
MLPARMADAVLFRFALALWLVFLPSARGDFGDSSVGTPPPAPTPEEVLALRRMGPGLLNQTGSFEVDAASREQVRLFHQTVYVASEGVEMAWTGDGDSCQAGTISSEFHDAVLRRINYFRALAGVPAGVALDATFNAKAQEAALMMSVNDALNHFPPVSWSCYTANGAEAASKSNIAIGHVGPSAITAYIEDFGAGNAAVGHRRWLLYPQTQTMGTGDVPGVNSRRAANAVWVFDGNFGGPRPATRRDYVSWPPEGYVPYQVVYPRWSFSYPGANFSGATVSMTGEGLSVPVTVEAPSGGTGDNTLVWYPSHLSPILAYRWPRPSSDTIYEVTVQNVVISGAPRDFTYQVIVFDPSVPDLESVLSEVTGPSQPAVGQPNFYNLTAVPGATAHQYRASRRVSFTAVAGAENGLDRFTANVSPGYDVVVTDPKASGSFAYHLAHPVLAAQELAYDPILVPAPAGAELQFRSRLGWATANQVARVQVLLGGQGVWQDIYVQPGTGDAGEASFVLRSISLAPHAGRSLQIRFLYDHTSGSYFTNTSSGVGWYIDDLAITNTEELREGVISAPLAGETFTWDPPAEGDYAFEARAQVFGDYYTEWGPVQPVTAIVVSLPPVLRFIEPPRIAAGQIEIEFEVENHRPELAFELLHANGIDAEWTVVNSATFETVISNNRFRVRFQTEGSDPSGYFRLRAK